MKGQMDTQYGKILIDEDVIATYAGSVAVECFGIVGMAAVNMKDGLVKLLKKDYLTHGISVVVEEDNQITIDFHVIIAYGVSIATVSDNLIETVKYKVESFTGMKINKINIYVEGVRVIDWGGLRNWKSQVLIQRYCLRCFSPVRRIWTQKKSGLMN